jgi:hypothetical protein
MLLTSNPFSAEEMSDQDEDEESSMATALASLPSAADMSDNELEQAFITLAKALRLSKNIWRKAHGIFDSDKPPFKRFLRSGKLAGDNDRPSKKRRLDRTDFTDEDILRACLDILRWRIQYQAIK